MSIKKVANIAGVSIATVSRYFNSPDKVSKKTQKKVQHAIDKINYYPNTLAQNLRRGKTGLIIVVVPKISSLLYEPLLKMINTLADERGYSILVKESGFNGLPLDYFKHMIRCKQSDGFIILTGLASQATDTNHDTLPIVLACEPLTLPDTFPDPPKNLPYLGINYFQAAKDATQHLLNGKHKRIAFIAQNFSSTSILEQHRGYLTAILEASLVTTNYDLTEDEHTLSLQKKLNKLIQINPKPTAIYCADDETAIEVIHWIKENGLQVPQDISIMGFHNTRFSQLCDPPLSTVDNPMASIGELAIEILFDIIDSNPSMMRDIPSLEHHIVVRESTRTQN